MPGLKPLLTCAVVSVMVPHPASFAADEPENVIVTARRVPAPASASATAITRIGTDAIDLTRPAHPNELAWQAPGAWVSRGSGQEHLTAIRSPVLTGPGSCGAFLFLEDGIPVRPAGFCNVNQLLELNIVQAHAIEIARGPLSAVWGANALHGAINVVQQAPRAAYVETGIGPDDYYAARAALRLPGSGTMLADLTHDGGFRADSGLDQGKLNWFAEPAPGLRVHLAATRLQQETAGFVLGPDAYRDDALRESNPNPEAWRNADALRVSLSVPAPGGTELRLYARDSDMQFVQHFLPGQPLERNAQRSGGVQWQGRFAPTTHDAVAGLDLEFARGELEQTQAAPTEGSDFLRETRPAGRHYDYTADSVMAAAWISATRALRANLDLEFAARAEYLGYEYDNRLGDGNLRDDGSACGLGGCLYNRPADRNDGFFNIAPRLGLVYRPQQAVTWRAQLAHGFRPPQATELYRLQRGQDVADLESERIDSLEAGVHLRRERLELDLALFRMDKRDVVLRDADGFNVSDGRTTHAGLELDLAVEPSPRWRWQVTMTLARHRYAFDRIVAGGEPIRDGADVDTAPRSIASARLAFRPAAATLIELEAVHMGRYYTDAANSQRYPGHELFNLRLRHELGGGLALRARLMNLRDRRFAERADFAFGNARYFPGRERALFVDLRYSPVARQ